MNDKSHIFRILTCVTQCGAAAALYANKTSICPRFIILKWQLVCASLTQGVAL